MNYLMRIIFIFLVFCSTLYFYSKHFSLFIYFFLSLNWFCFHTFLTTKNQIKNFVYELIAEYSDFLSKLVILIFLKHLTKFSRFRSKFWRQKRFFKLLHKLPGFVVILKMSSLQKSHILALKIRFYRKNKSKIKSDVKVRLKTPLISMF